MEQWLDFAKGPLFAFTFLIMILGLSRHFIIQFYSIFISKGKQLKNVSWKKIFFDIGSWVVPVKHLIKGTVLFSTVSFIFHVSAILVSLFFIDHIILWEDYLKIDLPSIGRTFADILTLVTIACILILIACRIFVRRQREMSRKSDYILLIMILFPFLFGFFAGHPAFDPFPWNTAMLLHILSAEALFIVIPFTKLAHITLYIFDRLSVVHWQLKPGAGDKVAEALFGKEAKV
jgi:nitrate reductase gamma subunit